MNCFLSGNFYTGRIRSVIQALRLNYAARVVFWVLYICYSDEFDIRDLGLRAVYLYLIPYPTSGLEFRDPTGELEIITDLLGAADGATFFDIGANIGLYSILVGVFDPDGSVFAFEPFPETVARLRRNSDTFAAAITVFELAVSDTDGNGSLQLADSPTDHHLRSEGDDETDSIPVQTTTIDRLRQNGDVPEPDIVKIDVEGAELDVLHGMEETLSTADRVILYCEVHDPQLTDQGIDRTQLHDCLRNCGFDTIQYPFTREVLKATKVSDDFPLGSGM